MVRWKPYVRIGAVVVTVAIFYAVPSGYQAVSTNTVQPVLEKFVSTHMGENETTTSVAFVFSTITAGHAFGAIFGSISASVFGEKLGPLRTLSFVVSPIYILGSILMSTSIAIGSPYLLIAARIIFGFGGGINNVLGNVYVTECSPTSKRGLYYVVLKFLITVGNLLSQVMGIHRVLGELPLLPYFFGLMVIPGIFGLTGYLIFPESPAYHVKANEFDKARKGLLRLYGPNADPIKMRKLLEDVQNQCLGTNDAHNSRLSWKQIFKIRKYRTPLLMAIITNLSCTLTGISIEAYSTAVFLSYGLPEHLAQYLTVVLYVVTDVSYFCSIPMVQRIDRRPMYMVALAAFIPCQVILAIVPHIPIHFVKIMLAFCCWLIIIAFRNISIEPLRGLIALETCQTELRVTAFSVCVCLSRVCDATALFVIYPLFRVIGSWIFLIFAVGSTVLFTYAACKMVETRNKSFGEISKMWDDYQIKECKKPDIVVRF